MMAMIVATVVAIPLVLGVSVGLVSKHTPFQRWLPASGLFPLCALVLLLTLEGLPAFPPIRAAHKLPYILLIGTVVFVLFRRQLLAARPVPAGILTTISLVIPVWWMGSNILANNGIKLATIVILVLLSGAAVMWSTNMRWRKERMAMDAAPQAVFAMSMATALVAILGGYMGMAMYNGALAAFAGGFLLVCYMSHLRGKGNAFRLDAAAELAFVWVASIGLIVTALLAPKASQVALIATGLTIAGIPLAATCRRYTTALPRAIQPLASGLMAAVPALAGILIAGIQFAR